MSVYLVNICKRFNLQSKPFFMLKEFDDQGRLPHDEQFKYEGKLNLLSIDCVSLINGRFSQIKEALRLCCYIFSDTSVSFV